MAIRKKPQEKKVLEIISKGGSVPSEVRPDKDHLVQLRVPKKIIERVDRLLPTYPVKISRHSWIMQAIVKYLDLEE